MKNKPLISFNISHFINQQSLGGALLIFATVLALILANSPFYGSRPGINNIELDIVRYFEVAEEFLIPVKASAVYNPLSDNLFVYFTIELIHNTKIEH